MFAIVPPRYQFNLRTLLMLVGGIALAVFLISSLLRLTRDAGARAICGGHLSMISVALTAYHNQYGAYPPAFVADANGRPAHSWRVLLLPFLGYPGLYRQYRFDEPWNSEHNLRLVKMRPEILGCPLDREGAACGLTNYVLLTGRGTAYSVPSDSPADVEIRSRGNAILVAEIAGADIVWTQPVDLDVSAMDYTVGIPTGKNISSYHTTGAEVLWGMGVVHFLPSQISKEELRAVMCGDPEDQPELFMKYTGSN